MLHFIVFAQLAAASSIPQTIPARLAMDSAHRAAERFVRTWRFYWESSELIRNDFSPGTPMSGVALKGLSAIDARGRRPLRLPTADTVRVRAEYGAATMYPTDRYAFMHCHPEWADPVPSADPLIPGEERVFAPEIIKSGIGKRAVCPSWYPGPTPPWNERDGIDRALLPEAEREVRLARDTLLGVLDAAARALPDDTWLAMQRVRFALDQGDTTRASRVVEGCRQSDWQCVMLRGYLAQIAGSPAVAESIFTTGLSSMPHDVRCRYSDASVLLDDDGRDAYGRIKCDDRDSLNTRLWWLSDPLWSVEGNDRLAAHYARVFETDLLSGTRLNERLDLREVGGGAAAREMLIRYGRPSFSVWGDIYEDAGHFGYLKIGDDTLRDHGRFVTSEYTEPRQHTVPAWSAIADPFAAEPSDWILNAAANRLIRLEPEWWPAEHFERREGPLVELRSQRAMFRRDSTVLLALATNLHASLFERHSGDTLHGYLVFSKHPSSTALVPRGAVTGFSAVFLPQVDARPQMVGLELFGQHPAGVVATTRFGIQPPPTLSTMKPENRAISDIALLFASDSTPPTSPDAALRQMIGTTNFAALRRFGIYWETYGFAPGDTVDIAIRIEAQEKPPSALSRLSRKIGLSRPTGRGVTTTWREPSSEHEVWSSAGRVPIQGRQVYLNLDVAPGDYEVTVTVTPLRGAPRVATRIFTILGG